MANANENAAAIVLQPCAPMNPVPGLSPGTLIVTDTTAFSDSRDVFNHNLWRPFFAGVAGSVEGRNWLIGIANQVFFRGKQLKINYKGKSIKFEKSIISWRQEEKDKIPHFENATSLSFYLNFPTEASVISSSHLTCERLKCVLRETIVPEIIGTMRFPATSTAIGFSDLVTNLKKMTECAFEDNAANRTASALSEDEFSAWIRFHTLSGDGPNTFEDFLNLAGAVSACISTKELYMEDEQLYPGTVAWAGVHSMMTDASNKIRAPQVSEAVRYQLENSNLYGDFKKKMASRNILIASSPKYLAFLKAVAPMMDRHLKAENMVSAEENTIIDSLVRDALQIMATARAPEGHAITATERDQIVRANRANHVRVMEQFHQQERTRLAEEARQPQGDLPATGHVAQQIANLGDRVPPGETPTQEHRQI